MTSAARHAQATPNGKPKSQTTTAPTTAPKGKRRTIQKARKAKGGGARSPAVRDARTAMLELDALLTNLDVLFDSDRLGCSKQALHEVQDVAERQFLDAAREFCQAARAAN